MGFNSGFKGLRISGVIRLLLQCACIMGIRAGQRDLIAYGARVGSFKITFERSKSVPRFRSIVISVRLCSQHYIDRNTCLFYCLSNGNDKGKEVHPITCLKAQTESLSIVLLFFTSALDGVGG